MKNCVMKQIVVQFLACYLTAVLACVPNLLPGDAPLGYRAGGASKAGQYLATHPHSNLGEQREDEDRRGGG